MSRNQFNRKRTLMIEALKYIICFYIEWIIIKMKIVISCKYLIQKRKFEILKPKKKIKQIS